ncbi:MAG TPA: beta-L-arabinofuranosidase domain-containing protein [Tepidisphaeraceae bacterium]|jgi:hypothetical protein|nr:beta-L-arabinofuranosidase domain-containing protein [Tepidisphaeraceae bacterium]
MQYLTAKLRIAAALGAVLASSFIYADVVQDKVPDKYIPVPYADEHITGGILADRMKVNLEERLLNVDEKAILEGFTHRPGSHPWIGEHAGKFLHAAANTYAYTHDQRLKKLMDRVAVTLIGAQLPDGYLGTYAEKDRWTSWDVWSHKYDMLGLLAWYDVTHDEGALDCCKKIGDLLCATFGDDAPGKKDLSDSGVQDGMAPTSVLEPMCYLYRHTGDKKYLDFCYYITRNIEQHSKIISSLTAGKRVDQTSNAKAYEMLSNLLGLTELYRLTGDEKFLVPVTNAWESIVKDHLYVSGTTSAFEHFRAPEVLPAGSPDSVGEGCVTVTWEQLNLSLLKLTADPKYGDQLERTIYNALLAAQNAENGDICYFTPLVGAKPYTHSICCCLSSEPRGIALIPQSVYGVANDAIVINLYAPGSATFTLTAADKQPVTVKMTNETDFPHTGQVKLTFEPSRQVAFDVMIRQPSWSDKDPNTYQHITIDPAKSKELELSFDVSPRLLPGGMSYPTCFAVQRGPQVLALDPSVNPTLPIPSSATVADLSSSQPAEKGYTFSGLCSIPDVSKGELTLAKKKITLVTFADATRPIVWMPTKDHLAVGPLPVTFGGVEDQSRGKHKQPWMPDEGAITDLRPDTYRTSYNRKKVNQDWYSVELKHPAKVQRVVLTQGPVKPDGGWFDTSAGKPEIQVKIAGKSDWQTVGTFDTYPSTTATDAEGLLGGQTFQTMLANPLEITAIRVAGKAASGNAPNMNYSNCAELAAYSE